MKVNHLLFAALWTLLALVVLWQYDPVGRNLDPDASFMLYAGQQILRGHAPYVGVTIVKLPVSPLVAAAGIAAGRVFGLDDILGGRLAFWLCAAVSVGAVYLIGVQLARDLPAPVVKIGQVLLGSMAAAALVSFQPLGIQVAEGPEAKLPMVCAGMLCLVLLARGKFFWAGLTGALSFLAWQPGLIFVIAGVIAAIVAQMGLGNARVNQSGDDSKQGAAPPDKPRAVIPTLAGIALPLVVIGVYLALNGALASMFRQAFGANANYFGEKKVALGVANVVAANVSKVWEVSLTCAPTELPLVPLSYVGMIGGAVWLAYRMWRTREVGLFLSAFPLVLSGAALFGFSLLDLQRCSDLVPLLPYLALGAGGVIFAGVLLLTQLITRAGVSADTVASTDAGASLDAGASADARAPTVTLGALGLGALALILFFGAGDAFRTPPQTGLAQQRELANTIAARLEPQDRVQQFGDALFLVSTQRENATRFIHLGEKQGLGILTAEGISMHQLTGELDRINPRVVTLSRAKNKTWAEELYAWLERRYALESSYGVAEGGIQKELEVYWRR